MKKYISVLGILAVVTTASFAEEESVMLDLDTVVEEVAAEPVEAIAEPVEEVVVEEVAAEVTEPVAEPVVEPGVEESVQEPEPTNDNAERPTHLEGDADYVTFMHQYEDGINAPVVIATGEHGDFLTYISESEELLAMYNNRDKTAMFLSVENPAQYIQPGKCLVNTIPYNTIQEQGLTLGDCYLRLFCGSEMHYDGFYAIELCGKKVQD
ncbi:MAG: hypothetical protein J6W79_00775 [Alphaproteobacteria bacterium]|nr:hypothetical protein [Alphaproteobacteria bacterium]